MAIPASSLRIGNYVKVGDIFDIITQPSYIYMADFYDPIPLTPEILEKAGFIKSPAANSTYKSVPELKAEIHFEDFRGGLVCVLYCSTGSFIPNNIKYLHQLQNLYHALSGEELTINL